MNRRNIDMVQSKNPRKFFPLVDDKLLTKQIAQKAGIAVPVLIGAIDSQSQVKNFLSMVEGYGGFVIKPAHGSGGKGILVIVRREEHLFYKSCGTPLDSETVKKHLSNILSGLYSLGGRNDTAMIEELVMFDTRFSDYSFEGVPDIRVIVYQGYPVMAMMRCSTALSDGKANLHQGAVGVGLDLFDGHAVHAVQNDKIIRQHPDTKRSFENLRVPQWESLLEIAASCYEITELGYLGADIVLDQKRGPLLLELNARPGLAIQIANGTGLLPRLALIDAQKERRSSKERVAFSMARFGGHAEAV